MNDERGNLGGKGAWLLMTLIKWSGQAARAPVLLLGGGSGHQLRTLTSSSPTTEIAVLTESRLWLRLLVSMVVGLRTCRVEHLAAGAGGVRG